VGPDCYVISWTVDYYYGGTRGRFPRTFERETDLVGAVRFAKRHDLPHWKPPKYRED
jgi:hypothetical protein